MSTDQPLDDESIRLAYRAAAQDEPGPQLDAQILQAAHAALATPARKPARWSWLVLPFSAAAVAIVVTTLVLQVRQTPSTPAQQSASAPAAQATKPTVAAVQPPELKIADAKPAKKAAKNRSTQQDQAAQIASAEEALLKQRRQESEKLAAAPALTRSLEAAPKPAPSIAQHLADTDSTPIGAAASGAARPSAAYAPPPPAAKRAEPALDRLAEAEARPAREPKLEAFGTLAKAPSPEKPTDKQLENIRKLQREGQLKAAKKALAELRKQFPHYKVSEDLRALIEPGSEENKDHP